jgi:hypothetical protein
MQPEPARNVFMGAVAALRANPIVLVPALLLGLAGGIGDWYVSPTLEDNGGIAALGGDLFSRFLWWFVQLAAAVLAATFTVGIAEAAWSDRKATLADGWTALKLDFTGALLTSFILIVLGGCAALLGPVMLFIPMLAFAFLTPYALPANIIGGFDPFGAINESFNLAWNHPVNTAVMLVGVAFVWTLGTLAAGLLDIVPFAGPIVGGLIATAAISFATLVYVGEYIALRGPRSSKRALS